MTKFFKQLFCKHLWEKIIYSPGCYDEEVWFECMNCGEQKDATP